MGAGKLATFFGGALTLLSAVAYADSVPQGLRGKSIIFTWAENHSQRRLGEANFRDVVVTHSHNIYISTTGRIFDRYTGGSQNALGSRWQCVCAMRIDTSVARAGC
jgi:hypothetical protein